MEYLRGRKTYIIAALMVMASIVKMVSGDISLVELVGSADFNLLLEGLGLSSLRAGIAKGMDGNIK